MGPAAECFRPPLTTLYCRLTCKVDFHAGAHLLSPSLPRALGPLLSRPPRLDFRGFAAGGARMTSTQGAPVPERAAKRRRKLEAPHMQFRFAIHQAAREGSWHKALQAYQDATALQLHLDADAYNSLLFLCAFGDTWEERYVNAAQGGNGSEEAERLRLSRQLFEEMASRFGQPTEMG